MRRAAFGFLVLLLAVAPAQAQQRTCRQVLPADFRRLVNTRGQEMVYFRDPVRVLCTGGVRLEADSAVLNRAGGTVELVGRVVYRDRTRRLRAAWANYIGRSDQLIARDGAVLTNVEDGTTVSGDQLNYLRETDTRPEARMIVTGGRPHAVLPPRAPAEPEDTTAPVLGDPADGPPALPDRTRPPPPRRAPAADSGAVTHVWAERLDVRGEVFRADGDVELERGDLTGASEQAVYDGVVMTLSGSAWLQSDTYRLSGDEIEAGIEGDGVREVLARGRARATSDELEVDAERIRIGFTDGEVNGMEAWNVDEEAPRIRARAEDFLLLSDSLDALADSAGIREVRAVGRAYGQRRAAPPDTGAASVPLPSELAHDWIQGDTILGFFERIEPGSEAVDTSAANDAAAATDTVAIADTSGVARGVVVPSDTLESGDPSPGALGAEVPPRDTARAVLERIEVAGSPNNLALSFYRMVSDDGTQASMNFMSATRIVLFMAQGDVSRVEAVGPIEGLYLDPARVAEPAEGEEAPEDEPEGGAGTEGNR